MLFYGLAALMGLWTLSFLSWIVCVIGYDCPDPRFPELCRSGVHLRCVNTNADCTRYNGFLPFVPQRLSVHLFGMSWSRRAGVVGLPALKRHLDQDIPKR